MYQLAAKDRRRQFVNYGMNGLLISMALLAIIPLLSIFVHVLRMGLQAVDLDFLTQIPKPMGASGGGVAHAMSGTALLLVVASFIGIPWGILAGVYLSEYSRGRIARSLRFVVELLASIPSIVVGLFAYAVAVIPFGQFSAAAAGFALSIILIPTVARTTEELLKLVPNHIREAGLALGIPRWKVTLHIVLRGSMGGVMTGIMLGVARIAGETAPLLFTALGSRYWSLALDEPIAALPLQIYVYAISPFEDWHRQAWGCALLLVGFVLILNLAMRSVLRRGQAG